MATETPTRTESGAVLERFSGVQVYVHGLIALSIFVLYLTGLPLTFNDQLGWLFTVIGHGNVILVHVIAGVVMIGVGTFYLLYLLLTAALSHRALPVLPTTSDVREAVAYGKYLVGRGEKPAAGKYTWLQKAEVFVLALELVLLSITGLLLWYRGIFVSPEFRAVLGDHQALADTLLLIVRDVHVVIAMTALMGISFHLYMVNVKEKFPFNDGMFSGTVSVERAAHEWEEWADEHGIGDGVGDGVGDGTEDGVGDAVAHGDGRSAAATPSRRVLVGVTLALLSFFAVVLLATLFASVLSPLPTREYLLALPFDPLAHGVPAIVFFVGLNVAVLVILAAGAAVCYGLANRLRGAYQ